MNINVFDLLHDARGLANEIGKAFTSESSVDEETTSAELWRASSPKLQEALILYEKKDSLPDTAWFGRESKVRCQKEIDEIINAVILVLETSGASKCREKIRTRQVAIDQSRERIVQFTEESISAPPLATTNSMWTRSCEYFEARIAAEELSIKVLQCEIDHLKLQFRGHLRKIGLEVSPEEVNSLVFPVQDGIVSMAAAILNVGRLTTELERLVEGSKESPANTRRYYGICVLLLYAIDRLQWQFIGEIDDIYLPKLLDCEQEARQNIADAQAQLSVGGPKEVLVANVASGQRVIEACRLLSRALSQQKASVAEENICTRRMLAAAANTYKTVCVSLNVAELMSDCGEAYRSLRKLKLPHLRPFQDMRLNEELHQLAKRLS